MFLVTHRTNNENWSNKGPYEVIGEGNPAAILEKMGKHFLLVFLNQYKLIPINKSSSKTAYTKSR